MGVRVEFFGVARQRSQTAAAIVDISGPTTTLAVVLTALAERHPGFGNACVQDGGLRAGYVANLDGDCFISDPDTVIQNGQSLLILAADAGG